METLKLPLQRVLISVLRGLGGMLSGSRMETLAMMKFVLLLRKQRLSKTSPL
ncbi:hypothetical protein Golax_013810 [Gossypium laxum]|uniref:Uncharacterized protein n=1 Tax=Gossypium laxum TaxID=34288 RepID=A0A7J8ZU74_9ROSI|nr:hypothetical protein [Gossypium laxum]